MTKFLITFILLVNFIGISICYADETISFPDTNFEADIRRVLKKPTGVLTGEDLLSITSLSVKFYDGLNISGIQYLKNLIDLDISNNNYITGISEISSLINLKS